MLRAIIFDFDYTLGDSTKGIVLSANYALNKLGINEKNSEDIKKTIGLSLRETYFKLTGKIDEDESKLFSEYFKEKADEVMVDNTVLYGGVKENLRKLKNMGCKVGVVTTKFHYRIEQILAKFNAVGLIDLIVGAEDVKIEKPNPEGLLWAIESLGCEKSDVLYVGDSVVDAETAQNADVGFYGVLTGTTTLQEFERYPNFFIGENISRICQHVFMNID